MLGTVHQLLRRLVGLLRGGGPVPRLGPRSVDADHANHETESCPDQALLAKVETPDDDR